MTLEQIDETLQQLSDSFDRSGVSPLEFDLDADRRQLEESSLEGETAARLASNRAPIETRNEPRALLAAYRAKAGCLRPIEDPRLADIFTRAQDALYPAPTDPVHVAELVRTYQRASTDSPAAREVQR